MHAIQIPMVINKGIRFDRTRVFRSEPHQNNQNSSGNRFSRFASKAKELETTRVSHACSLNRYVILIEELVEPDEIRRISV